MRVNAMVIGVHGAKVANSGVYEIKVIYPVDHKSVLLMKREPDIGEVLPEGVVKWVKEDENDTGMFVVGIANPNRKAVRRKSVFMPKIPEIGSWIEVRIL